MVDILNITNGDCAVDVMRAAGLPGVFLPWRDVLHEGPVPANLTLAELSAVRAQYIADRGWGELAAVRQNFVERDRLLQDYRAYSSVILWFEHDLYDQLQMLQILAWFSANYRGGPALKMICTEQYLGMATPAQLHALKQFEQNITRDHLTRASQAWQAFCSATPEAWCAFIQQDTSALPFLRDAFLRLREELPNSINGLSRTAQQALRIVATGERKPGQIFARYQETEPRRFLGDSSFWSILRELLDSNPPLLQLAAGKTLTLPASPEQELSITAAGQDVLAGRRNWLDITKLDRWIGGVHLIADNVWRWNAALGSLAKQC